MSNSAYAPYILTYGQTTPYITADEYQRAPTAVDVSNLIQGGPQSQLVALQETIARASSWIDQYVTGSAYNTLCATSNVENATVYGNRTGQIIVHPKLWPILEVQSFSYTVPGLSFTASSITPQGNVWIEPQQFTVQPNATYGWNSWSGANTGGNGATYGGNAGWPVGISAQPYLCTWTYVNGFPNSSLSASVSAGAASITVQSGIGIYPGSQLTIYDAPNDEDIQIADSYVPGGNVLPLVSPLQHNHEPERSVTNIPKVVKQAAILLTSSLIKQRGSGALIAEDMGVVTRTDTGSVQNNDGDMQLAKEMLGNLRQRFIGY
jgi:hypothetical protein